ncbi:AAA family ATPase [Bacillus taeanensis]|uniref:Nuclease SbcCD subunit C n=1 Tax=Bacillus taeanensis TaxID=273032 RepID=A0A366XQL3_9BACI|nr:AAA family ATPase [Bacillus taeanensis]RBW68217.1 hypothetical protein DS031_17730 [Bacillus taeanensis]
MNLKIKGIELEAFRAYKERQFFNFTDKQGEVANLIVLYAPNGYGKTSFYDAVEWLFTGKINRISNNSVVKNTADSEQGNILKNINSEKKVGRVKVITENDYVFEKITKELGKFGRKSDYSEGDITFRSSIFNDYDLSTFSTKYILGQDKIDSFLRFSNPRERFDTLSNFWDESNDSTLYKTILSLHRESEKEIKYINNSIEEVDNEIKNLVMRPNIIKEVNEQVKKLNNLALKNKKLKNLEQANSEDFISKLINFRSDIQNMEAKNEEELTNYDYLLRKFDLVNEKKRSILEMNKELEHLSSVLAKYTKTNENEERNKIILVEIHNQNKRLSNYRFLQKNHEKYTAIYKQLKEIEKANYKIVQHISNLKIQVADYTHLKKDLSNQLNTAQQEKEILQNDFKDLDTNFSLYKNLIDRKGKNNRKITKLSNIIEKRNQKVKILNRTKEKYEALSNYKLQSIINESLEEEDILKYTQKLKNKTRHLDIKKEELELLEKEYIEFGKLNDDLNKIIKHGKKIIQETRTSSCPLCNKKYDNYSDLVKKVNQNINDTFGLEKITKKINLLKEEITLIESEISEIFQMFQGHLSNKITALSKRIAKNDTQNSLNRLLMGKLNNSQENTNLKIKEINTFFGRLKVDIHNRDVDSLDGIKVKLKEELKNYDQVTNANKKQLKVYENKLEELDLQISNSEKQIVTNNNTKREIKNDPVIEEVNQKLNELNIDYDLKFINEEISDIKKEITKFLIIKDKLDKENEILVEELKGYDKTEVLDNQQSLLQSVKDCEGIINEYNKVYTKRFPSQSVEREVIESEYNRVLNHKEKIDKGFNILGILDQYNNYIENNILLKEKESKKEKLESKLSKLVTANDELSNIKDAIVKSIEEKINSAFNLDSINSVYQRIDPHPDFNNIKFESDLTKDKPELHIKTLNEKDVLAPILYFSSAQVNILSLSIFLARSLIKDNSGVDSIFMDDPIQHLDNLNILSFIDLLRTITTDLNKQIIISTHNENFYKLIKRKMDPNYTSSKFIELESFGKVKV